jgi:hypothetical protein
MNIGLSVLTAATLAGLATAPDPIPSSCPLTGPFTSMPAQVVKAAISREPPALDLLKRLESEKQHASSIHAPS